MSYSSETPAEPIQSLLIPQQQIALLLPSKTVVEILGYRELEQVGEYDDWVLGTFSWRHVTLPLLSMEKLLGLEHSERRGRKRIIIIHVFAEGLKVPFVGIESTGMPRVMVVHEENLQVLPEEYPPSWPVHSVVEIQNHKALIPDLDRLGEQVRQLGILPEKK